MNLTEGMKGSNEKETIGWMLAAFSAAINFL